MDHRQVLSTDFRAFLVVGLLGGFTTFSAFGYETFTLARAGDINATIANIGIQIAAGLGAVWLGYRLATVG
jgi:CrcB protein